MANIHDTFVIYNTYINRGKHMEDIKMFSIRMPRKLWIYLKREAALREMSMMQIIVECLEHYKERRKKFKLKLDDE